MAINPNEERKNKHTLAIGMSGSGKTYFLKNHPMIKKRGARVIIWDAYESHDCHYAKSLGEFGRLLGGAVRSGKGFKVGLSVNPTLKAFEAFCAMVWAAADGNKETIVIVEELGDVSKPAKASQNWGQMVRVGRKFGLVLFPVTQRPQEIDKTVFTQVSRIWCGLVSSFDRVYVEKYAGFPSGSLETIKPESYHYYYVHGTDVQKGTPQKKVKI